jgi:hypothetical protein
MTPTSSFGGLNHVTVADLNGAGAAIRHVGFME